MKTVFLVQKNEADTARRLEEVLLSLPEDAGILFVSASVVPDPLSKEHRKILYRVVIGCSKARDIDLIALIAKSYLRQELQDDSQLTVEVHRGMDRKLRYDA